jgi:hypothetical protein
MRGQDCRGIWLPGKCYTAPSCALSSVVPQHNLRGAKVADEKQAALELPSSWELKQISSSPGR